ncbi:hypothetical protein [Cellulosilyticum sp. I15G10I2]|uniref:hypothetical protein n=1 Tax=Cellulosilyticum sp. I15G10I2 TaxID=1892843 RepID=UPI00114CAA72|nr:hypothetical protein [Cellulosilyticum sp. I15G10I2]
MHECKGCDRRVIGCHSTCSDYIASRAQLDAEIKARSSYKHSWPTAKQNFRRKTLLSTHMK